MGLETGDYIKDLVPGNPAGTDPISQGFQHIDLIKKCVQQSFPNIDGAVTASDVDLNNILAAVISGTAGINATTVAASGAYSGGTGQLVPAGAVFCFAGPTVPTGYLLCNGATVNVSQYPALYAAIGNTYGGTAGSTFVLPNSIGRMAVGQDPTNAWGAGLTFLGAMNGNYFQALSIANMPAHNHPGTGDQGHSHFVNDPGHAHGINGEPNGIFARVGGGTALTVEANAEPAGSGFDVTTNLSIAGNGTGVFLSTGFASIVVGVQGSGSAFSIMNPVFTLQYIIKT